MAHAEFKRRPTVSIEAGVLCECVPNLQLSSKSESHSLHEIFIGSISDFDLIVNSTEHSSESILQHIQNLTVVNEIDVLEFNAFVSIHRFLLFERTAVKQLLKPFVCIVDAQLLETVLFKNLKAENIQKADELVSFSTKRQINLRHLHFSALSIPTIQSNRREYSSLARASQFWIASRQLRGITVIFTPFPSFTVILRVQIASFNELDGI